jgi:hypothetical protein
LFWPRFVPDSMPASSGCRNVVIYRPPCGAHGRGVTQIG